MGVWINKPKKKRNIEGNAKERHKIYNSPLWKKIRKAYVMQHPTSEISEWEGKSALTEHVHHIVSFMNVPRERMEQTAYDYNNLIAVTQEEHTRLHIGDLRGCTTKEEIRERVESIMLREQREKEK